MKVVIFGSGYVGLVTSVLLCELGHDVTGIDVDPEKVAQLQKGFCPIYEPELPALLEKNLNSGQLAFSLEAEKSLQQAEIVFIAVGTPQEQDGQANLQFVESVARTIGRYANSDIVVVNKSTVPVQTCQRVNAWVLEEFRKVGKNFSVSVVSNPEFLKEGSAIQDAFHPDRIVIGVSNEMGKAKMASLYGPYLSKIVWMDPVSSEFTKYVANAMLATKISFMNEMSQIAEKIHADIELVKFGISLDARIGSQFINPGCGYGGSCFPKDVRALIHTAAQVGVNSRLLEAVDRVNEVQKTSLLRKLQKHFQHLEGKTIAIWGLSFKPNTDDIREAPSRILIEGLWEVGAIVRAFDPVAMNAFRLAYADRSELILVASKEEALQGADALVVVTEWKEFLPEAVDFGVVKASLNRPIIIDGRNLYSPLKLRQMGFIYEGIGRL